jgi:hypothetical protein
MLPSFRSLLLSLMSSLLLFVQFAPIATACPTCGCSELCAVTMFDDSLPKDKESSLLSNSIWGNIILKMAYDHDPELQKLRGKKKVGDISANSTLAAAAAGTLPQTTVSIITLNPPDGVADSYIPGTIGLVLESAINVALWTRLGLGAHFHKKIKTRQLAIRQNVEDILHHLEFSDANCPEAQKQLTEIIGENAASECIDLWRSSHKRLASGDDSPSIGLDINHKVTALR